MAPVHIIRNGPGKWDLHLALFEGTKLSLTILRQGSEEAEVLGCWISGVSVSGEHQRGEMWFLDGRLEGGKRFRAGYSTRSRQGAMSIIE